MQVTEPQAFIENRTFDEIALGESASLIGTLSRDDVERFATLTGSVNPSCVDGEYARSAMFQGMAAVMWGAELIATLLGTKLPGPGTVYVDQTLVFRHPIAIGDRITVTVTASAKEPEHHRVTFNCACLNEGGEVVISGTMTVIAPTEKIKRLRVAPPEEHLHEQGSLHGELIANTARLAPIRVAVVHPVDRNALLGAVRAAEAGLIVPILIGPESRIRAVAAKEHVDLEPHTLVPTKHSHEAVSRAVALAHAGKVDALMKGSLHTEELMQAVVTPENGLTTDRRMSHVFVVDVPTYPKLLLITDAALNIEPDLTDKRDIVQNAVELAQALGIDVPKVAILSAVDMVNARMRSTVEAAALAKMADRGQIVGGVVDGPLAFDNAISRDAARVKGIVSPVAGQADILVVPDLEAGNMLAKQLEYFANAHLAGIVLGGRVPIVLTSRADNPIEHMTSCALALLLVRTSMRRKVKP